MLSMKAKYTLKALAVMVRHKDQILPSKSIAGLARIPHKFLDVILQELRNHGIIESKRGIFGGYSLAKPSSEIMLGDIIRLIDGPLAPVRCASVTAYQQCEDCSDEALCEIRRTMVEVRNSISKVLDNKSLKEFSENNA